MYVCVTVCAISKQAFSAGTKDHCLCEKFVRVSHLGKAQGKHLSSILSYFLLVHNWFRLIWFILGIEVAPKCVLIRILGKLLNQDLFINRMSEWFEVIALIGIWERVCRLRNYLSFCASFNESFLVGCCWWKALRFFLIDSVIFYGNYLNEKTD